MLIEVAVFELVQGAVEATFLAGDARWQEALSSSEGFVRRTTARAVPSGDDGGEGSGRWCVLTFWASTEHADASQGTLFGVSPWVNVDSLRFERFESLD